MQLGVSLTSLNNSLRFAGFFTLSPLCAAIAAAQESAIDFSTE